MDESVDYLLRAPKAPGDRLGSRYVIGELLGQGAGGVVHAATTTSGGEVAVKFLRADLASDDKTVARFLQERQIFRKVNHPNVVRVHDLVAEGDDLAIVMDLVSGGDLRQRIADRSLDPRQAMTVAAEVAGGLMAIHRASVVHRDLKPANILLTEDLQPKISDFGIARLVVDGMTRTSTTIGTPLYMAPEAADQRGAEAPADIYALGVVMFELLTGGPPFTAGGTFAIIRAHTEDPPPRIEGVPTELADLIDWMLAKDPAVRPSAEVVLERLRPLIDQIEPDADPVAVAREGDGFGGPAGSGGAAVAAAPTGMPAASSDPIPAAALGGPEPAEASASPVPGRPGGQVAATVHGSVDDQVPVRAVPAQQPLRTTRLFPEPAPSPRPGTGPTVETRLPDRISRRTIEVAAAVASLLVLLGIVGLLTLGQGDGGEVVADDIDPSGPVTGLVSEPGDDDIDDLTSPEGSSVPGTPNGGESGEPNENSETADGGDDSVTGTTTAAEATTTTVDDGRTTSTV